MLKPSVRVQTIDGYLVADFWDCLRLDPQPVRDLSRQYEELVDGQTPPDLVIDLGGVEFAGSTALGAFNALQRACKNRLGRVVFCNVEDAVREVFRVSRLESLYVFVDDVPEATRFLRGAATIDTGTDLSKPEVPRNKSAPPPPLGRRKRNNGA